MTRLLAVTLLAFATSACLSGVDASGIDGGASGDAGIVRDGGGADAGPGTDGGSVDGGVTDGGGGVDGGGVDGGAQCTPGATRCNGPRVETCSAGTFLAPADCTGDSVCRQGSCVPVASCAQASPACCAFSSDCAPLQSLYGCPECRPVVDQTSCLAGVCESKTPTSVDIHVVADATGLPAATRIAIRSAVVTVYRGVTSDGRLVTCPWLLPPNPPGPHDAKDPTLNAVYSEDMDFVFSSGSDVFKATLNGVPQGSEEAIVFSVYDQTAGNGTRVGRGCIDMLAPTSTNRYTLTLK